MADIIKGNASGVFIGAWEEGEGTNLAIKTYKDSIILSKDDDTVSEENSDQDEEPIAIFQTPGKIKINFSTFDYSNAALLILFGGSVLNGLWGPPIETALEPNLVRFNVEFDNSVAKTLIFEKCVCKAKFNHNIKRDGLALIEVEIMPVANKYVKIGDL